ncbi:sensor histidine kinase [Dactylosporangium sp. CA-092794]|uniref:sensor histidine kinase n=1 Tax=Dactylosporangium sp. CA-092794 TaxID=3239929 RepID=UPI003D935E3C
MKPRVVRRLRIVPGSIRGRLLSGILVLVAMALVGTDVAAYVMVRAKLDQRIDDQLIRTVLVIDRVVERSAPVQTPVELSPTTLESYGSGELNVLFLDRGQRVLTALPLRDDVPGQAALIAASADSRLDRLRSRPDRPIQLELDGAPYRVVYHPLDGHPRLTATVIALSFLTDQQTLNRLAVSEALVSAGLLLVLALLALGVLRVGLRPLGTMAATATAIADGDTARRVPVDRPGTEVGQLAIALNHAFDERRRAEERLRRFVADASHELRTPLTTIRGWADLYFQEGLPRPSDVETGMSRIAEAAAQMGRLVEELLLLARLDEQRPLDIAEVELAGLVGDVIADARVVDPGRPIAFTTTGCGGTAVVVGDADRLGQVVRNLVGNALQHTSAGTPVEVSLAAAGPVVRLSVADAGPGIPDADQRHLFDRFYRAGPGRGSGPGSGLGLAIVRAVVEAHGGTVAVASRPGEGTRFDVNLPTGTAKEPPDAT